MPEIDLMRRVERGYFPTGDNRSHAKRVLLTLAAFADQDGTNAFPSRETIALYCRMSLSSVKRGLTKLREEGMIEAQDSPRASGIPSDKRPNQYRLCTEKLVQMDPVKLREMALSEPEEGVLFEPDGGSNRTPTKSMYQSTSSQSMSETDLYLRSHDDGATPFTEAQSAQEIDDDDEEIDQDREGQDDPPSFTAPGAKFFQSENAHASSITADSVPLSGHDVSSEQAREPSSEPQGSQAEESPTYDPQGSQNGAQPLQNPDLKAQAFGWQPSEKAMAHARAICPDVNLDIIVTEYWLWCHDKKINPTASHWMKWVTRAQRNFEEAQAEKRREEALKAREEKPWYEKDLRF